MDGRALFLLFNHTLTEAQAFDARNSLGVERFVALPIELRTLWAAIPEENEKIEDILAPIREWLYENARPADVVLVQGDFGAVFLMVRWCEDLGLVPVYSTTRREAEESKDADGAIRTSHVFRHIRFRRFGK